MMAGVAGGAWVGGDVVDADGSPFLDDGSEQTVSTWKGADACAHLVGNARGDELLDLRALGVEHAQRSIAGVDQLAAEIDHVLQHGIEIEFAGQRGGGGTHGL